MKDARLKIAQCICHWVASGKPVTPDELQFSFDMASEYGDDAVWQQQCAIKEVKT
ncbi:MAG: hypothetical protein J6T99_07130 [Oscillospiraceae bacterium]|nr:hypothetical protein [Oscillospiraceae bacterium]